jgi:hypothetical protein
MTRINVQSPQSESTPKRLTLIIPIIFVQFANLVINREPREARQPRLGPWLDFEKWKMEIEQRKCKLDEEIKGESIFRYECVTNLAIDPLIPQPPN